MNPIRLILAAALSMSVLSMQADSLVIMHTNDTHSQIDPDDSDMGGVQRRKVVIDSIRAANENTLLIDAGDIVQGTLFFNLYAGEVEEKMMNMLGYDMRILGNHEFDNGMQMLADNLSMANAELLCANYQMRSTPLAGLFKPYAIREIGGRRIAFLPVNLQPKGMIMDRNTIGLGYVDAIEAANNMAWYLKNIEEADMVIALTHIGYSGRTSDVELIRNSTDIDLVIGGHTHTYINPDDPNSVPYVIENAQGRPIRVAQAQRGGRYLGEISISLDDLSDITTRLIPIDSRLDSRLDPAIEEVLAPYRSRLDSLNSNVVSKAARDLDKSSPALLNFISDYVCMRGRQLADNVDFTIYNKGSLRNSLPKGNVTEGQIMTMVPFFNHIQVIDLPGTSVLAAFDVMARANGNGVSSEISAVFDPDTDKCLEVTLNGKPIDPDATYRVATVDYLALGGDYMQPLTDGTLVAESDCYLFQDLLKYLKSGKIKKIDSSNVVRMRPNK